MKKRFESAGWHTITIDGHDRNAIRKAIKKAQKVADKPSLIIAKTIMQQQLPELSNKLYLRPEVRITEVRVVDIDGLDVQADGGTHVASTREVGRIRIVGHESKGRINKRLRLQIEDA